MGDEGNTEKNEVNPAVAEVNQVIETAVDANITPYEGPFRVWWDDDKELWFAVDSHSRDRFFGESRIEVIEKLDQVTAHSNNARQKDVRLQSNRSTVGSVDFDVGDIVSGTKVTYLQKKEDGGVMIDCLTRVGLFALVELEDRENPRQGIGRTVSGEEQGWIRRKSDGTIIFGGPYEAGVFSVVDMDG